ncbi:uncharacterized protein LOC112568038 [Pomacea canaliculata]|uniref:uncharacterized protein LOC112568038 n=1 Tax=Pomacea canaliculata TaxID=400727 RepID=UPI000D727B32|nr:uncharacterized protein LOC112568038 [Pomacea canaliculata]XP_025100824.1 uncharacterized protein LOC112568038 [Pomacea canaliculata]XP_025100825.1 uncharacterized protein LOC112568038 [Pomacea canaliculata]XP_025100826.1 uncharacterized protein LOC112568038 [Pomacea canaliculata]XP_025100827.1 uncharacterized protein LOC112568038 [Pomacea canaliculata]XP_025100829.1 uncharacterized protein LOC112568038 [Pomacea canaliculata]XP_025100830.1 uncharacterized protein LOC112568038 [Pomacea cana
MDAHCIKRLFVVCIITVVMTVVTWSVYRGPTNTEFFQKVLLFVSSPDNEPVENLTIYTVNPTTPGTTPVVRRDKLVEIFPNWTTADPHDAVPVKRVYLYSATLTLQQTPPSGSHIRLTAFQEKRVGQLTCCFRRHGSDTITSPAHIVHSLADPDNINDQREVFAVVYQCHVPFSPLELTGARVTVTPDPACPVEDNNYIPVYTPEVVKGGLAICGKVAFGSLLDPLKLVEWFEMQKLLGVDKIQILDFGNPENVTRVFKYYQNTGLLSIFPYKLPGRPWGRGFTDETRVLYQLNQDEDFPILECRLRLAGYEYVMGIDMDEIILPRNELSLKPCFQQIFGENPVLAAAFFHVQFFVEEFGPEDKDAPLHVLRYLKSTPARWECQKYTYIPARTNQGTTHSVSPYPGFYTTRIASDKAVIHHYRKCPHVWPTCTPTTITDRSITRFKTDLVPRVKDVLSKIGF